MWKLSFVVSSVAALKISPGAITSGSGSAGMAAGAGGAGGSGASVIQELSNLIGPLATTGVASGPSGGVAMGSFPTPLGKEADVRRVLVNATKTFEKAADVHEDAKTLEIENSIAAALGASSAVAGGQDASAAASFLKSAGMANGFTYRNALFTSQLLRNPAAARINVITKNNGHGARHAAAARSRSGRAPVPPVPPVGLSCAQGSRALRARLARASPWS